MLIAKQRLHSMLAVSLTLSLLFCAKVYAATSFSDIQEHWAAQPIQNLETNGIINGYPDGTFKPDQAITRAELAKIISKTLNYQPVSGSKYPDIGGHWAASHMNAVAEHKVMNSFADGKFQPERTVSRAQLATFICRILNVAKPEEKFGEDWSAGFADVPNDHWAFRYIELCNKLGLLPDKYQNLTQFHPDQAVTRAEAAWMIHALAGLEVSKGKISHVDSGSGLLNIQKEPGNDPLMVLVTPETVLIRNNAAAPVDDLLNGDEVTVISQSSGDVKFLKAFGRVTKNDLLSRISSMMKGKLDRDQIAAIMAGDWDSVKDGMKGGIYNRLIDIGLTPAEAESIMVQDWNYLDTLSRDRLAQALSDHLGITIDFSQALLARDLEKIKEYGKIELATAALSRLLGMGSPDNGTASY
ncbi:MAG: S-layer homology domain-containing protein [Firmicutes bacterium]|nr:S-layer homology domain-containing protein [Bacillota bacterium]